MDSNELIQGALAERTESPSKLAPFEGAIYILREEKRWAFRAIVKWLETKGCEVSHTWLCQWYQKLGPPQSVGHELGSRASYRPGVETTSPDSCCRRSAVPEGQDRTSQDKTGILHPATDVVENRLQQRAVPTNLRRGKGKNVLTTT